jgi:predicted unusual protein kinase regulating ubiquinone biosynthesis (AarF/ABC1/UbiB family)
MADLRAAHPQLDRAKRAPVVQHPVVPVLPNKRRRHVPDAFRPGGQVTFLDFGLVKHFTADEVEVFADMIRAMVFERDTARFRKIIERVGLLRPGEPFTDQQIDGLVEYLLESVRGGGG